MKTQLPPSKETLLVLEEWQSSPFWWGIIKGIVGNVILKHGVADNLDAMVAQELLNHLRTSRPLVPGLWGKLMLIAFTRVDMRYIAQEAMISLNTDLKNREA